MSLGNEHALNAGPESPAVVLSFAALFNASQLYGNPFSLYSRIIGNDTCLVFKLFDPLVIASIEKDVLLIILDLTDKVISNLSGIIFCKMCMHEYCI